MNLAALLSERQEFIEKVTSIISTNLSNPDFNVNVLCKMINLEQMQLHRKLVAAKMPPPVSLIRQMRLEAARMLIRNDFGNVSQIMYAVGFISLGSFSTIFKKHFHVTPTEMISLWVNFRKTE